MRCAIAVGFARSCSFAGSGALVNITIRSGEASETHSSSGVIVSTGVGSNGWLKSLLTGAAAITQSAGSARARQTTADLFPVAAQKTKGNGKVRLNVETAFAWDTNYLFYTVREPFPTNTTGATLIFGRVTAETPLLLESGMAESGVIFSDGIKKALGNSIPTRRQSSALSTAKRPAIVFEREQVFLENERGFGCLGVFCVLK